MSLRRPNGPQAKSIEEEVDMTVDRAVTPLPSSA